MLDFLWVGHAVAALLSAAECLNDGPINVGSGLGVSLKQLSKRVQAVTGSRSRIRYLPARRAEVVRFVAHVKRMRHILGIEPPEDPLSYLELLADEDFSEEEIRNEWTSLRGSGSSTVYAGGSGS